MRPEDIYNELHSNSSQHMTIKAKSGEMGTDEKGFLFSIGLFILMCFLI